MTQVDIFQHKEYPLLKVEVNGSEYFYGNRSDFLPEHLISILQAVDDGHIEINRITLTGP